MLCATIYEYKSYDTETDVEATSNGTNNNERISTYADRNLTEERRISMIQDNGKELIEKMDKSSPVETRKEDSAIKRKKSERGKKEISIHSLKTPTELKKMNIWILWTFGIFLEISSYPFWYFEIQIAETF